MNISSKISQKFLQGVACIKTTNLSWSLQIDKVDFSVSTHKCDFWAKFFYIKTFKNKDEIYNTRLITVFTLISAALQITAAPSGIHIEISASL